MNVIQEAQVYAELLSRGLSRIEIADQQQVDPKRVRRRLVWLDLPKEVQQLVAEGQLQSNHRVAEALARLPREYQIREARRFAQSGTRIEAIEASIQKILNGLATAEAERSYGRLSDGRMFLAVTLAEQSLNGNRKRNLTAEAIEASKKVCDLCSLYPSVNICKPCPLVTMLTVLMRRKSP